jgi:hypothetical protein
VHYFYLFCLYPKNDRAVLNWIFTRPPLEVVAVSFLKREARNRLVRFRKARCPPWAVCYRKNGYLAVMPTSCWDGFVPSISPPFWTQRGWSRSMSPEPVLPLKNRQSFQAARCGGLWFFFAYPSGQQRYVRPIRKLDTDEGFDITTHKVSLFGTGPQHFVMPARALEMKRIFVPGELNKAAVF